MPLSHQSITVSKDSIALMSYANPSVPWSGLFIGINFTKIYAKGKAEIFSTLRTF